MNDAEFQQQIHEFMGKATAKLDDLGEILADLHDRMVTKDDCEARQNQCRQQLTIDTQAVQLAALRQSPFDTFIKIGKLALMICALIGMGYGFLTWYSERDADRAFLHRAMQELKLNQQALNGALDRAAQ